MLDIWFTFTLLRYVEEYYEDYMEELQLDHVTIREKKQWISSKPECTTCTPPVFQEMTVHLSGTAYQVLIKIAASNGVLLLLF